MNYVMHFCRNKECNNGWIDKDLTRATSTPPSWKYCKECAAKLGIDYEAQTPTSNLTVKELETKNKRRKIFEQNKKRKINSNQTKTGQERTVLSQQDKLYQQKI